MLGEDEPHPVAALAALTKLRQRLLEHAAGLGGDEAFEIEGSPAMPALYSATRSLVRLRLGTRAGDACASLVPTRRP